MYFSLLFPVLSNAYGINFINICLFQTLPRACLLLKNPSIYILHAFTCRLMRCSCFTKNVKVVSFFISFSPTRKLMKRLVDSVFFFVNSIFCILVESYARSEWINEELRGMLWDWFHMEFFREQRSQLDNKTVFAQKTQYSSITRAKK